MYRDIDVKTAIKKVSITNYSKSSVAISDDIITPGVNSFIKQTKIYKNHVEIDTKPLIVECINYKNTQTKKS